MLAYTSIRGEQDIYTVYTVHVCTARDVTQLGLAPEYNRFYIVPFAFQWQLAREARTASTAGTVVSGLLQMQGGRQFM